MHTFVEGACLLFLPPGRLLQDTASHSFSFFSFSASLPSPPQLPLACYSVRTRRVSLSGFCWHFFSIFFIFPLSTESPPIRPWRLSRKRPSLARSHRCRLELDDKSILSVPFLSQQNPVASTSPRARWTIPREITTDPIATFIDFHPISIGLLLRAACSELGL